MALSNVKYDRDDTDLRLVALDHASSFHDTEGAFGLNEEEVLKRARLYYAFLKGEEQEGR